MGMLGKQYLASCSFGLEAIYNINFVLEKLNIFKRFTREALTIPYMLSFQGFLYRGVR